MTLVLPGKCLHCGRQFATLLETCDCQARELDQLKGTFDRFRRRTQALLYLLTRDHLPAGTITQLIRDGLGAEHKFQFSSQGLADWAHDNLVELEGPEPKPESPDHSV